MLEGVFHVIFYEDQSTFYPFNLGSKEQVGSCFLQYFSIWEKNTKEFECERLEILITRIGNKLLMTDYHEAKLGQAGSGRVGRILEDPEPVFFKKYMFEALAV